MSDVNGNKEAIKLLEYFLQVCQNEPIGYAAVALAREPNKFTGGFSGTVELEKVCVEGLEKLKGDMNKNVLNRTLPEPNPKLDKSYVCYNVTSSPLSFDFTTWMVDAEMTRIREGAPGPLKVGFWFGRDGKTGFGGDNFNRKAMLDNVVRPSMKLIGAVEDPLATEGHNKEFFSYKYIVEAVKNGEKVPIFKSDVPCDLEPGYVTITLRETSYWTERNSRIDEWVQFAKYLKNKGERVIFIRDTAKADEPIEGFETLPRASRDLLYRCSVYDNAKCNLFVSNGPISLAYFGTRPWLKFFEIDNTGLYPPATEAFWEACCGIKFGEQWPWSSDKQRIVWKPDYYTNLVLEWEKLGL